MTDLEKLSRRLRSMTVFRCLLSDPAMQMLLACLEASAAGAVKSYSLYASFAAALYASGGTDLSAYVEDLAAGCETPYTRIVAAGGTPSPSLEAALDEDLRTLQQVADLTPEDLGAGLDAGIPLPGWENSALDLRGGYRRRMENIGKYGCGVYARHRMFRVDREGRIVPVARPDPVRLSDLIGYQREKLLVLENTRALLRGAPAANMLLTGDAGTGKSSTVKAVVNELWDEGLRIVELRQEQLRGLPAILERLTENPLKFILFIDDLSFSGSGDDFNALKAMLEGSVSVRTRNVAVYATSNRRHLVKESFSDREGDDVHVNDTLQELASLSERFGLHVTFRRPGKAEYLDIVRGLAASEGIAWRGELETEAERFALTRASRSPRAARQFVDGLLAAGEGRKNNP